MSDVKWIKIVTDIFDNKKIRVIESMPDGDSIIVIWFKILILAGNVNDNGCVYFTKDIPYNDQMLATVFNRPLTTIQLALKTFEEFGMIEIVENIIHVSNWEKYQNIDGLDKIREQTRLRVAKHREQKKLECNVTSNVTVTHGNATEEEIDIEKEKKEKKKKHLKDVDDFFESVWKLYIRKEGKNAVNKEAKEEIFNIGYDRMKLCIEKYAQLKQGSDKKYILMGSTFFNGRYKDYLNDDTPTKQENNLSDKYADYETVTLDDM